MTLDDWLAAGRQAKLDDRITRCLYEFTAVWSTYDDALRAYRADRSRATAEALRDAASRVADVQHNTATQVSSWPVMLHLTIYLDALDRVNYTEKEEEAARKRGEITDIMSAIMWRKQHPKPGKPASPAAIQLAGILHTPTSLVTDDHLGHGRSLTTTQLTPPRMAPAELATRMAAKLGLVVATDTDEFDKLLKLPVS